MFVLKIFPFVISVLCVSAVISAQVVSMQYRNRNILNDLIFNIRFVILLTSHDCSFFGFIVSLVYLLSLFDNVICICSCHFKNGRNKCRKC